MLNQLEPEELGRPAASLKSSLVVPLVALLAVAGATPVVPARAQEAGNWIGTWSASPQPIWAPGFLFPTNIPETLRDKTFRQSARISVGGNRVRIVLSNAFGASPVVIGEARVALAGTGAATLEASDRAVTFGGRTSATIPPGAPIISDPIDLPVQPLASLSISLFLPEETSPNTFHWDALQTSYIADGNQTATSNLLTNDTTSARILLSGILVDAPAHKGAVVILGDSISDGAAGTPDANRRWPDYLAERLAPKNVAVLNAGISGARLLTDKMGVNALARFDRDVLSEPHVKTVVVLIGINDISWPGSSFEPDRQSPTAEALVEAYRQLILRARLRGIRIIGATLTPFEGALDGSPIEGYYTPAKDALRQQVNEWIRSSGEFDAVIDFDALARDPDHPERMLPAFDSGDHLHPGDAGYKTMADAVDIDMLLPEH
ncbi:SGNH/GDSL hydrolase family protein [Mesorhizobium sp. ASY16-5R]|uniref:SGNH/GDSL hydrolase family protein n=1 Tax=Mesorhizobium sp. ASY16-5R TaxID=3445772 RepID=UPI003FA09C0D